MSLITRIILEAEAASCWEALGTLARQGLCVRLPANALIRAPIPPPQALARRPATTLRASLSCKWLARLDQRSLSDPRNRGSRLSPIKSSQRRLADPRLSNRPAPDRVCTGLIAPWSLCSQLSGGRAGWGTDRVGIE